MRVHLDRPAPRFRDAATPTAGLPLALDALGVVYGDIGTSPLYALQAVFAVTHHAIRPTPQELYGITSMIFWTIALVVSVKYIYFVMRADNGGEGGVMALTALVRQAIATPGRSAALLMTLGVLGAALFYGDSAITPAISVLSAVEGLKLVAPDLGRLVLPVAIIIVTLLFGFQRRGTHRVGKLFGPVMAAWFVTIAVVGMREVALAPRIMQGLLPTYAARFVMGHPQAAFFSLGAVVLVITGAEALYADEGHFGRSPIRQTWFALVFPALTLNYLGQGALVLRYPAAVGNPFFLMVPPWARVPIVVLAAAATVVASQAVISGGFSASRQAVRLGYLPYLRVSHTSPREEGQIYVPAINWLLFAAVLVVMVGFRASSRLATAYGLAVTGTFLVTTVLFLAIAKLMWRWSRWKLALAALLFGGADLTYFTANLSKVGHGGWVPLVVAAAMFTVMTTWQRGREIVTAGRTAKEGSLLRFIDEIRRTRPLRVPGTAVFPHPPAHTAPLALRANFEHNHIVHERAVIVSVVSEDLPYLADGERLKVDNLSFRDDGVIHVTARYGFQEEQDIPHSLRLAGDLAEGVELDPETTSYFVSRVTLHVSGSFEMSRWRKRLFIALAHNAADPSEYFGLPESRTIYIGSQIGI